MGCWERVWAPLIAPALVPGETTGERMRKRVFIPFMYCIIIVYFIFAVYLSSTRGVYESAPSITTTVLFSTALVKVYVRKNLTPLDIEVLVLVGCSVGTIWVDLKSSNKYDVWAGFIVGMDALLVARCKGALVTFLKYYFIAYLLVKSLEETYQFGLYDFIPSEDTARECEPLALKDSLLLWVLRAGFFVLDFIFTRSFAEGMAAEQARSQSAVDTAGRVANALAAFNLEEAEEALLETTDSDLCTAFRVLLANLRSYRPYLPEALFHGEPTGSPEDEDPTCRRPPGMDGSAVYIVFTDIQSSSALWESSPAAMRDAMAIHDSIVRSAIRRTAGYEVKTIGDAFMVAFSTARDALEFCLGVQVDLHRADWPVDLMGGRLNVRMGVNGGEAEFQVNPVMGTADYYGPVVNTAARLERVAKVGTVCIPEEVYSEVSPVLDLLGRGTVCVQDIGEVALKGIAHPVHTFLVSPSNTSQKPSARTSVAMSVDSSTNSSAVHPLAKAVPPAGGMSVASAAAVRVECTEPKDFSGLSCVMECILEVCQRSDGLVQSVCGATVHITWNASRPCPSHLMTSVQFCGTLHKVSQGMHFSGISCTVGVTCGPVMFGNLGTGKQRFVVVSGQCIEVAGGLASAAKDARAFALTTELQDIPGLPSHLAISGDVRMVDTWDLGGERLQVYEVCMQSASKWGMLPLDLPPPEGWSLAVRSALLSRDVGLISSAAGADPVLQRVVELIKTSTSLKRPIVLYPKNEAVREASLALSNMS